MIARYRVIAEGTRNELDALDATVASVARNWAAMLENTQHMDAFLDSVAFNLHSFYTGLERICVRIATEIDGSMPRGSEWHVLLLQQMTTDLGALRPPVFSTSLLAQMDEYRRFRHLVRNIYTNKLDVGRVDELVAELPAFWTTLRGQFTEFAAYLDSMFLADEPPVSPHFSAPYEDDPPQLH